MGHFFMKGEKGVQGQIGESHASPSSVNAMTIVERPNLPRPQGELLTFSRSGPFLQNNFYKFLCVYLVKIVSYRRKRNYIVGVC